MESASAEKLPLRTLTDIPLTGGTTRFDYQSLDTVNGRLYIAHLGSDLLTVFDVNKQTVIVLPILKMFITKSRNLVEFILI
ncbi:MAG TPA: hypothetical protein VGQ39_16925 [Pyrinomonadaceae bacterium]|nr:hypothetical protein [Pyrinomonadaceae bacterium]